MGYEIIRDAATFDYFLRDASTKETYPLARSPVFGVFSEDDKLYRFSGEPVCLRQAIVAEEKDAFIV